MISLVKNIKILGPEKILDSHCLLIEDGYIKKLGSCLEDRYFDEFIDGGDLFLAPGFIDIHNHGSSGYDVMDSTRQALDALGNYHISKGVTSYIGTIISSSKEDILRAAKNLIDYEGASGVSRLLGIHLEGPFFNPEKAGAQPRGHLLEPDLDFIKELLSISRGKLLMVSLAPEFEGSMEVIDYLVSRGVVVALAHSLASYERALEAIDRGARIVTHLYNGMGAFDHREPGLVGASLTDDRVYCELIFDNFHVHSAAVKLAMLSKGYDKLILVSDAMMAAGLEDGDYWLGGQRVQVRQGKPRLSTGAIAGSTLDLRQAVENSVKLLGVPLVEAVKMASLNPARALGLEKFGSIEEGKIADFILMDGNLKIHRVYRSGLLAYED